MRTPEYVSWQCMRDRCYNPNNQDYMTYGGANPPIIVEFATFQEFLAEVGPRPGPEYTIDRYPDKTGNYGPGNTRWATWSQQSRNLKSNLYLTLNNVTKLVIEWSEDPNIIALGLKITTIEDRLKRGWSAERILTEPIHCNRVRKTIKHGASVNGKTTAEYRTWTKIRNRCNNPNSPSYIKYGGASPPIIVAPEWDSFEQFLRDVGPRPSRFHSLDRYPNQSGNYEPGNVRWSTATEQNRNLKSNRLYEIDGVVRTLAEYIELCGITRAAMRRRLAKWDLREALTTPNGAIRKSKLISLNQ